MSHDGAGISDRVDALDGARDAHLMAEELLKAFFKAMMPDQKWRRHHVVSGGAHRNPDGVIVGENVGERSKAADAVEDGPAQGDRCSKARLCQAQADGDDSVRQELPVDSERL